MVNSTAILAGLQAVLSTSLDDAALSLNTTLSTCTAEGYPWKSRCESWMRDELPLLTPEADFESINTTIAAAGALAIDTSLDSGLEETVANVTENFYEIQDIVRNTTEGVIDDMEKGLDEVTDEVMKAWDELQGTLRNVSIDDIKEDIDEIAETVHEYADEYYTWFYVGIVGIITAVGAFNILGLAFGILCKKPTDDSSCMSCTSAQGGCFLMVSVFLIFLLGWVLMLITIAFYAAGGGLEFLACRHLVVYDETMQEIERLTFNSLEIDYNISIRNVIDDCRNNTALYSALQLEENGFNITELLDELSSVLDENVDELKNITVDIGTVELVTDGLNTSLTNLGEALGAINFEEYENETSKDLVMTNVTKLAGELMTFAKLLNDSGNDTLGAQFTNEANTLYEIVDTTIMPMEQENEILAKAVADAETDVNAVTPTDLLEGLSTAESAINNDASTIISNTIVDTADLVVDSIERYIAEAEKSVIHDLGDCYPIYDTLKTMTYSTCVYFLYPFNSVWFCVGWFLFCCVFTLIFGTKMAGYYRQLPEKRPPPRSNRQQQNGGNNNIEMHTNPGYDPPPDYDSDDDGDIYGQRYNDPPPKYNDLMKKHFDEAKAKDKQRKAEKKQQEKAKKQAEKAKKESENTTKF